MPGRPWSTQTERKRAAILAAAVRVFVRDGFSGATVDDIAALAGVGKQTVYNYFGDKNQLFLAAIQGARPAGAEPADLVPADGDPAGVLTALGERVLDAVLDPERAALHRLTIAELDRHPELQRMWSEAAAGGITDALAGYLSTLPGVTDPALRARQFVVLLAAEGRARSLHGLRPLPADERRTIAAQTADLILRASTPR